jgi:hypothetical protein
MLAHLFMVVADKIIASSRSHVRIWWYLVVGGVILALLLLRIPSAEYFLHDPDGGTFLLGSLHIVKAGEFPIVDFFFSYGPMAFFNSAAGQLLSGGQLIGEVIVCLSLYLTGYCLFYLVSLRLSGSHLFSSINLVLALFLFPRFYKYFTVLLPSLWLLLLVYFHRNKGAKGILLLGAAAAYACLYRHDYAAFMVVSFAFYILAEREPSAERSIQCLFFVSAFLAVMMPWFLFLAYHGGLISYFSGIYTATFYTSIGLSLPHPLLHWESPIHSGFFLLVFIISIVLLVSLISSKGSRRLPDYALYIAVASYALANLIQSSHRADLSHLLQGIPASLFCIAILWKLINSRSFKMGLACAWIMVCGFFIAQMNLLPPFDITRIGKDLKLLSLSKEKYLEAMSKSLPQSPDLNIIRFIKSNTTSDQRVHVFPFNPQLLYLSNRLSAGRILELAPGYFSSPSQQQAMIETIKGQDAPLILWNEDYTFDNRPDRNPVQTHSLLHSWVQQNYEKRSTIGNHTIYMRMQRF